jgi:hypothetical protein
MGITLLFTVNALVNAFVTFRLYAITSALVRLRWRSPLCLWDEMSTNMYTN